MITNKFVSEQKKNTLHCDTDRDGLEVNGNFMWNKSDDSRLSYLKEIKW